MDDAKTKWEEDSKITRACADAMGIRPNADLVRSVNYAYALAHMGYDPLHDDAQAMALVRKFGLDILSPPRRDPDKRWCVRLATHENTLTGWHDDLRRAICLCVARLPAAQQPEGK